MTKKDKKKAACCQEVKQYSWYIWDGMGFFGSDSLKLDRLKGKEPKWTDAFLDGTWILTKIMIALIIIIIL